MTRWFGNNEYYFDQLREFVPRDALAILEQQKERISKSVNDEIQGFGTELAQAVKERIDAFSREAVAELEEDKAELVKLINDLESLGIDRARVATLRSDLNAYEKKWKGYGERTAGVVKAAIKSSTGIPI